MKCLMRVVKMINALSTGNLVIPVNQTTGEVEEKNFLEHCFLLWAIALRHDAKHLAWRENSRTVHRNWWSTCRIKYKGKYERHLYHAVYWTYKSTSTGWSISGVVMWIYCPLETVPQRNGIHVHQRRYPANVSIHNTELSLMRFDLFPFTCQRVNRNVFILKTLMQRSIVYWYIMAMDVLLLQFLMGAGNELKLGNGNLVASIHFWMKE